ncbi:MAG: hypothetical protein RBT71_00325 [Flavobacteriales bacterium]|nr:hypothetical protein [Flavobacteriales bacterium]
MTRKLILLALIGTALHAQAQQPRIVVQHAGNVQVFSDLTEAILAAPANSDLYLSGGAFLVPGGFALDKTLHFIGAGIHTDSTNVTGATTLTTTGNAYFRLTTGANGSSFTGIRFHTPGSNTCFGLGTGAGDQDVESVEFLRCAFQQGVILGAVEPAASSSMFTECIFHNTINGYDAQAQFSRCIFDHQAGTGAEISGFGPNEPGGVGQLTVVNCVGLGTRIGNSPEATVTNSVFTRTSAPFWQSNNATLHNNLLVSSELMSNMTTLDTIDNILGVPVGGIFQSEGDNDYQFSDNLHLQSNCPGVGAGTDGTDVGVYGTASPYKDGAMPHVPHFRHVAIAPGTDANGDLPVQVKVAAQAN